MDLEMVLDLLEKHGIDNIALAHDIQTLAKESYQDGRFDESFWWVHQDTDDAWIGQFDFDTEEEIFGDIPYQTDLHSKLDVDKLQAKQIENSDMADAILSMFDEKDCIPPSQELIDAYERFKKANIKIDLDKPLDEEDED